jgi:cytochrome P450
VYLDLWPLTYCYALVYDGVANQQFTQVQSLNKHQVVRDFLVYMTQTHDLFSSDGQIWKTWRSRFNPGFSSRNISTMIPELMEEVLVFVDILKQKAGPNGTWGQVFPLEPKTTNLTFDIIVRAIL